jgi:hypothetical protein
VSEDVIEPDSLGYSRDLEYTPDECGQSGEIREAFPSDPKQRHVHRIESHQSREYQGICDCDRATKQERTGLDKRSFEFVQKAEQPAGR